MGTIAQANASVLLYASETTWGTAPTSTYSTARIVSSQLAQRTGTVASQELNTRREPFAQIRTQVSAEGSIDFEWSALSFSTFLESLFGNTWSTDISATATGTAIDVVTVSGGTCGWVGAGNEFLGVRVGDWVRSDGFVNSANNGSFYVSAKTGAADITVVNPNAVAETTATAVEVSGRRLAVGTTLTSMALQQTVPTTEVLYELASGVVMTGMTLDMTPGEVVRGSFSWIGKNVVQSTVSITTISANSVLTTQIANAVDNIIAIRENGNGSGETWKVSRFSLSLSSPADPRFALSDAAGIQPGAISVALRPFSATATLRIYVEHGAAETGGVKDILDAYLSNESRDGLAIIVADTQDTSSYHTIFQFQQYKITNASIPIGGNDQDLFLDLEIAAEQKSGTGATHSGASSGPWAFSMHRTRLF